MNITSKYEKRFLLQEALKIIKEFMPKIISNSFSGSSPPEVFIGQHGYPQVFTGILAPLGHQEDSDKLSSPEEWFKSNL